MVLRVTGARLSQIRTWRLGLGLLVLKMSVAGDGAKVSNRATLQSFIYFLWRIPWKLGTPRNQKVCERSLEKTMGIAFMGFQSDEGLPPLLIAECT
jgi:hypothetical protein